MTRVLLVDDHPLVLDGLARLLGSAGIEVVDAVRDGDDALRAVAEDDPDVVVMDLQMPGEDGVSLTRRIVGSGSRAQVMVLTSYSDSDRILGALDAGAVGYLLKDAEPDDLVAGIEAVARGESPIHPRAARALLTARARGADTSERDDPGLTVREAEVLSLVRSGLANKQIARRLGISERTVKAHLTSVYQRIGVADRTQAALWAQQHEI